MQNRYLSIQAMRTLLVLINYEQSQDPKKLYYVAQVLKCITFISSLSDQAKFTLDGGTQMECKIGGNCIVIDWREESHIQLHIIICKDDWFYRNVYYLEDGLSEEAKNDMVFFFNLSGATHKELGEWSHYNVSPEGLENTV